MDDDNYNVITLFEVTAQEEIFCQYFLQTALVTESAYHAGMLGQIKNDKPMSELTKQQCKDLNKMGNVALKRERVKKRISSLAEEQAKKYAVAGLDELLQYLSTVVRQSRENLNNVPLANAAIRAIETMIKRYPEFASSQNYQDEKFVFSRFKEG
jgi:phage terminase small subunit